MRIAFDARSYFMRTGIARYTRGLVHALAAAPGRHQFLFLISDQHTPDEIDLGRPEGLRYAAGEATGAVEATRAVEDATSAVAATGPVAATRPVAQSFSSAPAGEPAVLVRQSRAPWLGGEAEREVLAREASDWGAELFHTVFPPYALPAVPTLTTVFDFSPFTHPELHQDVVRNAFADAWATAAREARGFVAVSPATADQVRERAGGTRPIWTIPCGLSAPFDEPPTFTGAEAPAYVRDAPAYGREGVVAVGTIEPRKNVALLLAASRRLRDTGRRIPVTLVGKRGWGYEGFEADLAATPDATWLGYATDEEVLQHYRRAAIAACPSVLEGFGLPTLEAMAQGALPLIAPDPALIDLVGRRDLVVPLDPDAWCEAIARWHDDEAGRTAVASDLATRAQKYRWPAIAEQCLPVYDAF